MNDESIDKLLNEPIRIPPWCDEPDANHPLGCWSLLCGYVTSYSDCIHCESYILYFTMA